MPSEAYLKRGFKRSKPVKGNGSVALCQHLARLFIDMCHERGFAVNEREAYIRKNSRLNCFKGKIKTMGSGQMRPYQYVYFFEVLFDSIGVDLMDAVYELKREVVPGASPVSCIDRELI